MSASYSIFISKSIRKSLLRVPSPWSERVEKALDMLSTQPFMGEKMGGKLAHCRKIRVWPYRIIYEVDKMKRVIIIVEVGHRGNMSYA